MSVEFHFIELPLSSYPENSIIYPQNDVTLNSTYFISVTVINHQKTSDYNLTVFINERKAGNNFFTLKKQERKMITYDFVMNQTGTFIISFLLASESLERPIILRTYIFITLNKDNSYQ